MVVYRPRGRNRGFSIGQTKRGNGYTGGIGPFDSTYEAAMSIWHMEQSNVRGLGNRTGRRARPPIATVYDPASYRTAFAYSDGDVAFGTGSPKSFVPVGRVIAKDSARQQKLMVGWVYRNEDPRGKQRGRKGRRNCVCL